MRPIGTSCLPILLVTGALAGTLGGCGASAPNQGLKPTPLPTPVAVATTAPDAKDPRPLIAQVKKKVAAAASWTGQARTDMLYRDGTTDYNIARLSYKRPGITAALVLKAKDSRKEGTKMVLGTDDKIAVKTYLFGVLPLRITLPVTDPRLLDNYGRSLRDSSTENLLGVLFNPATVATYDGIYRMDGVEIDMLRLRSPGSWSGVSHETMGISRALGLPVLRYCYDMQDRLIVRQEIRQLRVDVKFPANEFTTD